MWWNILPSMVITSGLLYVPYIWAAGASFVYAGSTEGRDRTKYEEIFNVLRDERILKGADPFRQHKHLGLDGIED